MVTAVEQTGASVTFCPNGTYAAEWDPYANRIKTLIAEGKVAICNHTYSHADLTTLSTSQIINTLNRNENWIEATFGISSRPYFRPPYGAYNSRVLKAAGSIGFTIAVLWSGSFADSKSSTTPLDTEVAIDIYAKAGLIMLGHVNYTSTGLAFSDIIGIIARKGLHTDTLPELMAGS